jgi:hypothetical protein
LSVNCTVSWPIRFVTEGIGEAGDETLRDDPGISCCTGREWGSGEGSKLLCREGLRVGRENDGGEVYGDARRAAKVARRLRTYPPGPVIPPYLPCGQNLSFLGQWGQNRLYLEGNGKSYIQCKRDWVRNRPPAQE